MEVKKDTNPILKLTAVKCRKRKSNKIKPCSSSDIVADSDVLFPAAHYNFSNKYIILLLATFMLLE